MTALKEYKSESRLAQSLEVVRITITGVFRYFFANGEMYHQGQCSLVDDTCT